jgi:hypothetical protein
LRIQQIFLLGVSAHCHQHAGTDSGRDMYRLNNIEAKTLPCGKPFVKSTPSAALISEEHLKEVV